MCADRVGAGVQVLTPLQGAIMFIQAETDPVEPLHISNLVAVSHGIVDVPAGIVPLTSEQMEQLEKPYSSHPPLEELTGPLVAAASRC